MSDHPHQLQDYPSLLLRLFHQSQGPHSKPSKKAQEELFQHLQTTSLPVECFDALLPHFLVCLGKGDAASKWLVLLFASNLLRTADVVNMVMHQQKLVISILPETLEKWWRLVEAQGTAQSNLSNLRDGVYVPNAVLQHEKLALQSSQFFALGRLVDTLALLLRVTDDVDIVDFAARTFQVILKLAQKGAIQNVFVRVADVLITWICRQDTPTDPRDVLVRTLFDMRELWADNPVFSLQLIASYLLRLATLAKTNQTLNPCDLTQLYLCPPSIDTVTTCAHAMVAIQSQDAALFSPLCVSCVDLLLLHAATLFHRHLATASDVSVVLDRALVLLEGCSSVQFSLPIVNLLHRNLPLSLPLGVSPNNGGATPPSTAPSQVTFLSLLCTTSQAGVLIKLTRVAVQCVRLGGIPALQVFGFQAVSASNDIPVMFFLMVFCLALASPMNTPLAPGDATCLAGLYTRLIQSLPKWTDTPLLLHGVKAIHCLMQFILQARAAATSPPINPADSLALATILLHHVVASPQSVVLFQVLADLVAEAPVFQLTLPLQAPVAFLALANHPNDIVRRHCVALLPTITPHPSHLAVALDRLFDSVPNVATAALQAVGSLAVVSLGNATATITQSGRPQTSFKRAVKQTADYKINFSPAQFELVVRWIDSGDPDDTCVAGLRLEHHPAPLVALKEHVWAASSWCVLNRLRTHWGNAGHTLAALEKLLLKPTVVHPRLVVELLHALELAISHMLVETTSIHDTDNHHQQLEKALAFFKTNRKVCDDWFLRIRPALVRLCDATGASGLGRHHALALVTSLAAKAATAEWDAAMYALCSASCDLQDIPGLLGYMEYAAHVGQSKPWMPPLALEAQMQYEAATAGYATILSPLVALSRQLESSEDHRNSEAATGVQAYVASMGMGPVSFKGVVLRCAQCFAYLQDWDGCRQWMNQALQVAALLRTVQHWLTDEVEQLASALNGLVAAWRLELRMLLPADQPPVASSTHRDHLPPLQEWTVLSVVDDAKARNLHDGVQVHTKWLEQRLRVLAIDNRAAAPHRGDSMSRQLRRTLMQLQCFVQPEVPRTLSLDPTAHDLGVWYPLASRLTAPIFEFDLQLIRLARKQRNFNLATTKLANVATTSTVNKLLVDYEQAQLLHATHRHAQAVSTLVQLQASFSATTAATTDSERRVQVKTLVKLAAWTTDHYQPPIRQMYLHYATTVDPLSCRAWLSWSHYWYQVSHSQMESISANQHEYALTIDEKQQFTAIVSSFSDLGVMASALLAALQNFESFVCPAPVPCVEALDRLTALYQQARTRVLAGYASAIPGYVTYLQCASPSSLQSHGAIVTLRLLGLLVKHGSEPSLQSALDAAVTESPLPPWERIVPQLLSRLAHPDSNAAARVEAILLRLAAQNPHLIVYPAVVESTKLTEALDSDLVGQVRLLIAELRRISLLWDEAWVSLLSKLSTDVARRSHTLEKEATRVERNAFLPDNEKRALAQRKFVAMMKPVLLALATLAKDTIETTSQTPHEHWFAHHFGPLITSALSTFQRCLDPNDDLALQLLRPSQSQPTHTLSSRLANPWVQCLWSPFEDILKRLNACQRRSSLQMASISPVLASWESSLVHMPGMPTLQIHRVAPDVQILATKTKPKCFELVGSDGVSHRYLLKAREDLHLDERIMQLLATVNGCLGSDKQAMHYDLSARHYNVIPLANDVGLIQMVRHVTPLFQIYTAAATTGPCSTTTASTDVNSVAAAPTAPFYAKLKLHGITNVTPSGRPHWPLTTLRQVYTDLVNEHPKTNVLLQELMRRSASLQEFGAKSTRFCRSVAVMSVVGYVIGLGDRHLDNMLLCHSGDLVHIDYNVCFDKGKKLKVPEVVPFRLTSIVLGALGLTGTDGRFRHSMETTLRVIRTSKAKETILALLEAFVYDPLVDWKDGPTPKKLWRMEMNVQLALFSSRAQERRAEANAALAHVMHTWQVVEDLTSDLVRAVGAVTGLHDQLCTLQATQNELHKQLAQLLEEVEGDEATSQHEQLEQVYMHAKDELDHFFDECQGRKGGVRQWLDLPDLGLPALASFAPTAMSFTDLYIALNLADRSLEQNCHALDKATDALIAFLRSVSKVQSALSWYERKRPQLYGSLRGPSVYDQWIDWVDQARASDGKFDVRQVVQLAEEDTRLRQCLDGVATAPRREMPQLAIGINDLDTTGAHSQLNALTHALSELKTTWKLSNAQLKRVLKVAVADHWRRLLSSTDLSVDQLALRVRSAQWLFEVGNMPKGTSFRYLPLDEWLLHPDTRPSQVIPALIPLHNFCLAIRCALHLVHEYFPRLAYGTSATSVVEAFRTSLDQAYALPCWSALLDSFGWVYDDVPVTTLSQTTGLEVPTHRPVAIWDLPGVPSLRQCLNAMCAADIALTRDGNVEATQYYWLDTLATIARMVAVDQQPPHVVGSYLTAQAASVLAAASVALDACLHTDICVQAWTFQPSDATTPTIISADQLEAEVQRVMPLDAPRDFGSSLASKLQLDQLVDTMAAVATASIEQAQQTQLAAWTRALEAHRDQLDALAAWWNVSDQGDAVDRSRLLALLPHMKDNDETATTVAQHEQLLETLLAPTALALTRHATSDDTHRRISHAVDQSLTATHGVQSFSAIGRWIEYVESTFRDSKSATCRAVDAEGHRVLSTFVQAKTAWTTHTRRSITSSDKRRAVQQALGQAMSQATRVRQSLVAHWLEIRDDVASPLLALAQAVAALLDTEKAKSAAVLWENERLVKILSKSTKRTPELGELQAAVSVYEATSANLHAKYTAVMQACGDFAQQCSEIKVAAAVASAPATTMASVVRGNSSKPRQDKSLATLSTDDPMTVLNAIQQQKLDGEASHLSVEQQVQWLIQEATSVDNLCQMYEGWTPWI
ncbi:hypothetical protein DYB36_001728 [Aphanomyces astaci]|uniref:non-specific serine/threonine protein kinase n=1 Tax=Aphanomyces astaci TaxID=112090 RepID=A0A397B3U3_APHAT|nr:hypothetical protein DYB36_001728 [Aphanomyces astaci]